MGSFKFNLVTVTTLLLAAVASSEEINLDDSINDQTHLKSLIRNTRSFFEDEAYEKGSGPSVGYRRMEEITDKTPSYRSIPSMGSRNKNVQDEEKTDGTHQYRGGSVRHHNMNEAGPPIPSVRRRMGSSAKSRNSGIEKEVEDNAENHNNEGSPSFRSLWADTYENDDRALSPDMAELRARRLKKQPRAMALDETSSSEAELRARPLKKQPRAMAFDETSSSEVDDNNGAYRNIEDSDEVEDPQETQSRYFAPVIPYRKIRLGYPMETPLPSRYYDGANPYRKMSLHARAGAGILKTIKLVARFAQNPSEAILLANRYAQDPSGALRIASRISEDPIRALKIAHRFASNPLGFTTLADRFVQDPPGRLRMRNALNDRVQLIARYAANPELALNLASRFDNQPLETVNLASRISNDPAGAIKVAHRFAEDPSKATMITRKFAVDPVGAIVAAARFAEDEDAINDNAAPGYRSMAIRDRNADDDMTDVTNRFMEEEDDDDDASDFTFRGRPIRDRTTDEEEEEEFPNRKREDPTQVDTQERSMFELSPEEAAKFDQYLAELKQEEAQLTGEKPSKSFVPRQLQGAPDTQTRSNNDINSEPQSRNFLTDFYYKLFPRYNDDYYQYDEFETNPRGKYIRDRESGGNSLFLDSPVRLRPRQPYKPYYPGYLNQGYNNQGYNNQGYNNQGYNNQGYLPERRPYYKQPYPYNNGYNNKGYQSERRPYYKPSYGSYQPPSRGVFAPLYPPKSQDFSYGWK